jgi:hypothetical protein
MSFVWNDDERDLSDLWRLLDERRERRKLQRIEVEQEKVIPLHIILKELYEEQRYGYCSSSNEWNTNFVWTPPSTSCSSSTYSSDIEDTETEESDVEEQDKEQNDEMLDAMIYKKFCYY